MINPFLKRNNFSSLGMQKELENELKTALPMVRENKPRLLLLGQPGAGKTSLLAKSGIAFTSPFKKSLENMGETRTVDWWIYDEAAFIDPAGTLCFSSESNPEAFRYWQHFLKKISKKFVTPFNSICLVVDLPSLVYHQEQCDDFIRRWQTQIRLLMEFQKIIDINIIVTQCDYLAGYAEFFSILDDEQQQQPLGFSLHGQEPCHVRDRFLQKYKSFISMINRRLLNRLHYEQNHDRRLRIHDFPMQLNRLEKPLDRIISSLPDTDRVTINNIFFCSSKQVAQTINLLSDDLNKIFPFKSTDSIPLVAEDQALFITKMIPCLIKQDALQTVIINPVKKKWWSIACYPFAIVLLVLLTAFFHHSYQKNMAAIHEIENNLVMNKGADTWLTKLNHLRNALVSLKHYPLHDKKLLGFNQVYLLNKQIHRQYYWHLRHDLMPYLNQWVANKVKIDSEKNSSDLYNSLQVYRMLAEPKHRDNPFITAWFSKLFRIRFQKDVTTQRNLSLYLEDSLASNDFSWPQDPSLINHAKEILQKQPLPEIAFKILSNSIGLKETPLQANPSIEGLNLSKAVIPALYLSENFNLIYRQKIPALAHDLFKGNWVMSDTHLNESELTNALQQIYLSHYLKHWQTSLSLIAFQAPRNFKQAAEQTNLLTNKNSPLWQLYQNSRKESVNHEALSTLLFSLHDRMSQIDQAPSSVKAAFDETAAWFQQKTPEDALGQLTAMATTLPEPTKSWVLSLVNNDRQLLLDQSKVYLNTMWQATVMADYNKKIAHRFPMDASSKEDISLADFNEFFGPGGTIQTYFNDYLRPFVDMSHAYWTWKTRDNKTIGIPQSTLDELIRASMIQKMFYAADVKNPTLKFSLTPIEMSSSSTEFALNIDGQMIRYRPGLRKTSALQWPGPNGAFATIRFDSPGVHNPTLTFMGPWAWLRLVSASSLQSSSDLRHYQITFKLDGHEAVYQLTADNKANPYLPNVLSSFRCENQL